jgi:creatinine amidohydrolase
VLWLELTSEEFPEAVRQTDGLCLVPFGAIERHGSHLPIGTDQITADAVARAAAEQEPAVVFPSYYFGKIFTARHYGGTVALTRTLLLPLLEATVEEIARNGFGKVLVVNGHGGNTSLLHFFLRSLLEEPRDYVVYATNYYEMEEGPRRKWHEMRASDYGGHGDEMETSMMLHIRPDLVEMDAVPDVGDGLSRGRTEHLRGLSTSISWYADHPTHYAGDARAATPEKGRFMFGACVDKVVGQMRAIKADEVSRALQRDFYDASDHSSSP